MLRYDRIRIDIFKEASFMSEIMQLVYDTFLETMCLKKKRTKKSLLRKASYVMNFVRLNIFGIDWFPPIYIW